MYGVQMPTKGGILGGRVPAHGNVLTHECIAHCSPVLEQWANAFADVRGDKMTRWGLLPNYFEHLFYCSTLNGKNHTCHFMPA